MAVAIRTANTLTESGRLWNAIDSGNVDELESVLANESLTNYRDAHGVTPLMRAACHNRPEVVRTLINHGADVNAARSDGFTPLLLAIFYGHASVVRLLCESGANVNVTTRFGTSAHIWAVARGFHDIADYVQRQAGVDGPTASVVRTEFAHQEVVLPPEERFDDNEPPMEELVVAAPLVNVPRLVPQRREEDIPRTQERAFYFDEPKPITAVDVEAQQPTEPLVVRKQKEPLAVRTLKEPPDIWDLVHENNSSFHAGSAFFTRITSIKAKTLLAVASILVGALCAFVALNWKALIDRIQPAAVVPSSSAQIVSDAKPPVVNRAVPDASNSQTAAAQQAAPDAVSSSAPAASSGVAGVEATTGTQASVPASSAIGSYRGLRRPKRSLDAVEPAQDIAEKPKSPEKSDTTTTSNRPASNAPAAKATVNGGNSQLIERPSGTATPKPKTIQWP